MAKPARGDVSINGVAYRIDVPSYRVRDLVDFSPRGSAAGNSILQAELGLYQPLYLDDWQHGFGFQRHIDEAGYLSSRGNIDTRHDGVVMMFTNRTNPEGGVPKEGFVNWNGDLYSWGEAGLRKYSGGAWSSIYSAAAVNYALPVNQYLHFFPDDLRPQKLNTGGSFDASGLNAQSTDYRWAMLHRGYIYAAKDGTSYIFRDSNADLSELEGDLTPANLDPNVIVVGAGGWPTLGGIVFNGEMFISRYDGLWQLNADGLTARRVLDFSDQISSTNFRSMAVHNGYLVFPIRDKVYQWNGTRLTDITPPKISDDFPYVTYGRFDNFVSVGRFLFVSARTNESTYEEHLLCFDGVGWHKLDEINTTGTQEVTGMGYDVVNNYLWFHSDVTTDGGSTYYIPFQNLSEFPYSDFPTSGTHELVTSQLDMGFRRVTKSTPSLLIEAANIEADGGGDDHYLDIYYSLEGGAWTAWGGDDGVTNRITADGVTELSDPLGTGSSTIEYKQMRLKVKFTTEDSTQTPILEGITVRFMMRPDVFYGHNFDVVVASHVEMTDGAEDRRVARDIFNDLKTVRDSRSPVSFVDIYGESHQGYISAVNYRTVEVHVETEEGGYPEAEGRLNINFVEVG